MGKTLQSIPEKIGINHLHIGPNVKKVPDLPYEGDKRPDEPFHWGTGQYAGLGWYEF